MCWNILKNIFCHTKERKKQRWQSNMKVSKQLEISLKAAVRNFVFNMYVIFGTPIKGVYIQTILDWFGSVLGLGGISSLYDIFLKAIRYEAIALISSLIWAHLNIYREEDTDWTAAEKVQNILRSKHVTSFIRRALKDL